MSDIKLFRIAGDLEAALEHSTKVAARLGHASAREREASE